MDPAAYGKRTFDGDLDWTRDRDEAMSCIESADILHLHHYFDLERNPFGIDFSALRRRGKRLVRQFHSGPYHVAGGQPKKIREAIESPVPQLVVAQYQERYYPRARLVPNLVPLEDESYRPLAAAGHLESLRIFFAPSSASAAWEHREAIRRWETKGFPETVRMLDDVKRRSSSVVADIRHDMPHSECLRARQAADLSIDDLVTGSFHLSSLEGLAQGVPTLAFLDARTLAILEEMTGTSVHPWINCRLEDAADRLIALAEEPANRSELRRTARDWMVRYWNDRDLVRHFTDAYAYLLERDGACFPARFNPGKLKTRWETTARADLAWQVRRWRHCLCENRLARLFS